VNATPKPRVRESITQLQDRYTAGDKAPLENLWRAWIKLKKRPAQDPRSFFTLAGYHGEPFRGPGKTEAQYWGGYCHHGNVLFPTWHRVYVFKLEEALRSFPGCRDVTLPYWDETGTDSQVNGIPWALTRPSVELDGKKIPNPLRSFKLTVNIVDRVAGDKSIYSKPKGYNTVRYPMAGLVGTPERKQESDEHNAQFSDAKALRDLNQNVVDWLAGDVIIDGTRLKRGATATMYRQCLDTSSYTLFSNRTSAKHWNNDISALGGGPMVVSLEQPHDNIHLAVGGFDIQLDGRPPIPGTDDMSPICGANGDMGEPDTAGFDPIFFFHHCFVDRVFWLWQQRHGSTDKLPIYPKYPGTNSSDDQGPTPGIEPNMPLDLDTPLFPFCKADETPYTSADCINIETQLGYTYGPGSLQDLPAPEVTPARARTIIAVSGINRAKIHGSFVISAFANANGKSVHLGSQGVFNRWNVEGCANCQTHLEVGAFFEVPPAATGLVPGATEALLADESSYDVYLRTHDRITHPRQMARQAAAEDRTIHTDGDDLPNFRFEIRTIS
jgi:tyrosinase